MRIKEISKENGMTISQLAEKMGMKQESLSRAINGNPTLETLTKIAEALNVPISELFDQPKKAGVQITCPHCSKPITIKAE